MKKLSLFLILVASAFFYSCKETNEGPKFNAEYGSCTITINLGGTIKEFVTVNVLADDKILDVITPDKPTVKVEFPIDSAVVLRTEAVCDSTYELPTIINMKFDATWDVNVMKDGSVIATNNAEYKYKYNYDFSIQSERDIPATYKICHDDLDRQFILTKTEIISPKK